jgi:predicted metal-dependent HD superfamily phosphohydrolase
MTQDVFNAKRAEILQRFLNRERIYSTEHFFSKYEHQARGNLGNSIRKVIR